MQKKGIVKSKIILENGFIQSYQKDNTVKIIQFNKTLLNFDNLDNRVIKDVKIQETSTYKILSCLKDYYYNQITEKKVKNCPKNNIAIVIETFSRRVTYAFIYSISIYFNFLFTDLYKK